MNRRAAYDRADWSRSDAELAKKLGVTPQAVGAARRGRGIAPAIPHGGARPGSGPKPKKKSRPKR